MLMKPALFILLAVLCSATPRGKGKCQQVTTMSGFDMAPYLGRWYEIQRFRVPYEAAMDCVTADYGFLTESSMSVTNTANQFGKVSQIEGCVYTTEVEGSLVLQFEGHPPLDYNVLHTDYESVACVYSCIQKGAMMMENAWVLSRNSDIDDETLAFAESVFERNGIEVSLFKKTTQGEGCTYVPYPKEP